MPQMANITVKKADTTTDIVFSALSPSSGDSNPSVWRSETAGSAPGHKPTLKLWSKSNGPKTARRLEYQFSYPQTATNSTTGVTSVVNVVIGGGYFVLPNEVPSAVSDEAAAQFTNLLDSALILECLKAGYAAT